MSKRLAPHLRVLDSREEKLDTLLENYTELCEPLGGGSLTDSRSTGKPGSRTLLMPIVWAICYKNLERCLTKMNVLAQTPGVASPQFRAWYFNLNEWYFQAERRRVPTMKRDKRGREYHLTTGAGPQYHREVHKIDCKHSRSLGCSGCRGGDPALVLKGLSWLSLDHPSEIRELSEVREKAA